MSKGSHRLKRGRRAAEEDAVAPGFGGTRVWFVATERDSEDQDRVRQAAESACREFGFTFTMRRSSFQRVLGGEEKDRPFRALSPRDAREVYQDAHLNRCLVIATHACNVKIDPSRDPVVIREMMSLEDFVAYKAAFALVRGASDAEKAIKKFAREAQVDCLGPHDPRALPLHVFDGETRWIGLHLDKQRARFDVHYGRRSGTRIDSGGRAWQQPNGLHGGAGPERLPLTVAGQELPMGYHWDVQKGRGKARLCSEAEIWMIQFEKGYLNVYPNGRIRGEIKSGAKRVWP